MPAALKNFAWSSLREEYLEYIFLGELCREFWRRDMPVDVLRSHTDRSGFGLAPDNFFWFCAPDPAAPMPTLGTRIARQVKANAQGIKASRPNIRALNKGQFEKIDGFDALATRLFPAGFAATVLPVMETTG